MISKKASQVEDSITMAISALATKMKAEGHPVLSFSAGEPDFDTPKLIQDSAIDAILKGKTRYTAASGIVQLKEAVCAKLSRDHGLVYKPENIVVSCGAKHSLYNAFVAMLDPGDEVIIPSPYWVSYPDQVKMVDGVPVIIETTDKTEFKVSPEQVEKAITPKTKLFILNSPSNPTGGVYSKSELEALAKIFIKHNIYVISDEIYEKLVYGETFHSIAEIPGMKPLTILINGVAKAYAMTGWRIGYAAAEKPIADAMGRIQSQTTSNPTTPSQWACVDALNKGDESIEAMRLEFDERRKAMIGALNKIPDVTCMEAKGAFYAFPNVSSLYGKSCASGLITDSASFCNFLLKEKLVACIPGIGFGADDYIRFSYACSMKDIEEGMQRLKEFILSLK